MTPTPYPPPPRPPLAPPLQFNFRGENNVLVPEDVGESESQFEGLQVRPAGAGLGISPGNQPWEPALRTSLGNQP